MLEAALGRQQFGVKGGCRADPVLVAGLPWTARDHCSDRLHPDPLVNRSEFAHGSLTWPQRRDRSAKRRDDLPGEQVEGPPVMEDDRDQVDAKVDERPELADCVVGRWAHHPVELVCRAAGRVLGGAVRDRR